MKYIRNLAKIDDRVMSVSPQVGKESRPFVGVVIVCGIQKYCIPLSSPKLKHKSMKNDVDYMEILDGDKLIGVLNFNNMIKSRRVQQSVSKLDGFLRAEYNSEKLSGILCGVRNTR